MSSTSAPFGLAPAYSPSGILRPTAYTILTGYATGIAANQPIKLGTNGTIEAAAVGERTLGTFMGVQYVDTNGRPQFSNRWIASTAGTEIQAFVSRDPTIIYEIQSNAALVVGDIGKQYDFTAASSNAAGISTQMLDVASSAANATFQLLGITPGPDNAWGDTYIIAQVRISEHQLVADVAAF